MATTPNGYPYPVPTDPVAQGAAAIQALAVAVDKNLAQGVQAGYQQSTSDANSQVIVTFPRPFAVAPYIVCQYRVTGVAGATIQLNTKSPTSFTVRFFNKDGVLMPSVAVTFDWIAVGPFA